ncbi:MAG: ABC transporter permease [Bdellovibrionaceae bacterium]|nr:ABC transporter permease [Pseudobdellovibrionaceae bacterium]
MRKTFFGFLFGLFFAIGLTFLAGENPWNVFLILAHSAFGSRYDFGQTLFYATPLIFCGLSVAWAFRVGLFNIGAEGQLTLGCLAAAWFGGVPTEWHRGSALAVGMICPLLAGGAWGFVAGWMKARRQAHEVIVTMMLNFVAAVLASYVVLNLIPNPATQNPESIPLPPQFLFKHQDPIAQLFPESSVSFALVLAILLAVGSWFVFHKSQLGYRIKMVGMNATAAARAGISVEKTQMIAMTIAGALAGAVAWAEVLGSSGQFRLGFSPDYGFLGIAVALMAQNNPLGILLSGLLLGALHKGAGDLDMETAHITRDFSKVLQAFIILFVASSGLWSLLRRKFKRHD